MRFALEFNGSSSFEFNGYTTRYMISLCKDCQHHLKAGIDASKVLNEQKELSSSIKSQTDAKRIAADLKKPNAMGGLFDHMELLLKESVSAINQNAVIKVDNAVSAISFDMEVNKKGEEC